jgi:hypothetical protein
MRYSFFVTARQIIEEYRKLPPQEQEEVRAELAKRITAPEPRFVSREKARALADQIFSEHSDLFRKLAE